MVAKIGVSIALLSLVALKTLIAAEESPNLADAKKEGKVVLYVSAQLPLAQTISRAFENKYPFLRVEITRTSGENLLNRIKTEKLAGKMAFDVVYGATVPLMPTLGVVKPYLSAEAKAYPAKFREPKDFWAGVSANYYVIGYNTKLVAKNEAPRDWKDLLHPRWKGRFAMDPEEFSWFGAMETYLGEEEAKKLMTGLARQDIQWRKNHTTLAQFLAAGEYPAALVYAHSIEELKGKGAPIDWVRTTAPIVLDIQAVALSALPPHPNAGKLFMDFLLSSETQAIIYQDRKIPIRPGVVPESSPLHPTGLELFPSPPKVVTNLNHYASKFEQIFGPRR
ncbi:MAG: extracellular solute-binding protein [Deltaproteobacteria bacterium]|nr:extracellular solute-binding protein [Deltaproteobacteria bacterium]